MAKTPPDADPRKEPHPWFERNGQRPLIIGLLGGIASGKSYVAEQLQRLGAEILDADRAGHEVLRLPEVEESIRQRWGESVFGPDGHIDRSALGRMVFTPGERGSADLQALETLTHPRIGEQLARAARSAAQRGVPAIVLDAPVMMKAGLDRICDKIIYVDAPDEVRLKRAQARGWTEEEFRRREATQEPLEVKRSRADVILDNSSAPESIQAQVAAFWQSLAR